MESTIGIHIDAPRDTVFALAADVLGWPRILPHYRWVRQLSADGRPLVVEMAAWRDVIPLRWRARVQPLPNPRLLRFHHIAGPTRGMDVEWRVVPSASGGTDVTIWHRWRSGLPLVGELYARYIVGRLFVDNVAGKTLRRMKIVAESSSAPAGRAFVTP